MNVVEFVEEQSVFSFTGRVKITKLDDRTYCSNIFLLQGRLVNANRGDLVGKKALYAIIVETMEFQSHYIFQAEPEVILDEMVQFDYTSKSFTLMAHSTFAKYQASLKLKPPPNLRLTIDPNFILEGADLTAEEFDTLATISDYSIVHEIYDHATLFSHEITLALIELRKKGAIKVVSSKSV